jgi:DNA-3-methyladenine glycosylase II
MSIERVAWWSSAEKSLRSDKHLGPLVKKYKGEGLSCKNDLFHTLCRSIVGQQISVKAADSVWGRFTKVVKRIKPTSVLRASEQELREAGLSRMKASYILGIAAEAKSLSKVSWDDLDDEQAIKRLTELRGIGRWTAEMALIFSLGRPDILPLGDIGLIRAAEQTLRKGKPLPIEKIESAAKKWRPYRTAATWYLWRSIDPVPVEY